ncbi:cyclophilin-like fold protein [Parathalassolituus penaei]|uniref:Cyclophilin-like fold protein n=1 Tax=Parathalassolituus penaei TaxID=2997323 RepID=A0A9X3IU65_9GAMM|nr:cyclophilin-like fold protein [Parathalassolituus penaei]MCY0966639.1 cyclophilin-like fold protein [Parathalassolituus penaei]
MTTRLMTIKRTLLALALGIVTSCAQSENPTNIQEHAMNIVMEIDGIELPGTLNDSAAARDFAAMLPLTLTLEDYASTEKISDLPGKLSTVGSPSGTAAKAGDITYYAPWGNLAIFYKPFHHASGLIKLGSFDKGAQGLMFNGKKNVVIRVVE